MGENASRDGLWLALPGLLCAVPPVAIGVSPRRGVDCPLFELGKAVCCCCCLVLRVEVGRVVLGGSEGCEKGGKLIDVARTSGRWFAL